MFRQITAASLFAITAILVTNQTGCSKTEAAIDPEVLAQHRTRLLLAEEPDNGQSVIDIRATLLGETESPAHNHDEHVGHDHDDHKSHDHDSHEGHDHEEHADHDHAEHTDHDHDDHKGHDHDAHAGHDHDTLEKTINAPTEPMEVVLVGKIGGLANPWQKTQPEYPFTNRRAQLFVADPGTVAEVEASGHVHAEGEACAFCEAHAADNSSALAMVRFVDKNGRVLPVDARKLFDIKERDTIVVRGSAQVIEGGMMVVDATGLYVRR